MPNTNPTTGIAYGVIDARKAMELWSTIQSDGVNVSLKNAEDDVQNRLRNTFAEFDAEELFAQHDLADADDDDDDAFDKKRELLIDWLNDCVQYSTEFSGKDALEVAEEAVEVVDTVSGTFKIDELVDSVMSALQDADYFTGGDGCEDVYEYEDGGFSYHLSSLGGAAMIWVFKGPYATYCRACSPCCPGAGDCDNFTDEDGGNCFAYCLDPQDIEDDADKPIVLYRVDDAGEPTKVDTYTKPETPETT